MNKALNDFSLKSSELNAYDYELRFRELTDKYNGMLFQASIGKVPISKNKKTSFGKIDVKKELSTSLSPMGFKINPILQEHICRLGSKLPFEETASKLSLLLRIDINGKRSN